MLKFTGPPGMSPPDFHPSSCGPQAAAGPALSAPHSVRLSSMCASFLGSSYNYSNSSSFVLRGPTPSYPFVCPCFRLICATVRTSCATQPVQGPSSWLPPPSSCVLVCSGKFSFVGRRSEKKIGKINVAAFGKC